MRFADIDNIWTADLDLLSKADRGRVYFERAKHVIAEAFDDPVKLMTATDGKRFKRNYLVAKIGCQPAVPHQNRKIQSLLADTDTRLAESRESLPWRAYQRQSHGGPARAAIHDQCAPVTAVNRTLVDSGLIVTTDRTCVIHGQSWPGIPTLVWSDGIDEAASDWFRYIVVIKGLSPTSAHEYANILRPFLRFCRQQRRTWQSVDDGFLIIWREHLLRGLGVSITRVNHSLKTIFAFYEWAENMRRVRYQVGIYLDDDLPAEFSRHTFAITAKRVFSKGRNGKSYTNWTTPLTLTNPEKESTRHTPTEEEIRNLHGVAAERTHGERDSLMMSFAEETGARRFEILQIGKRHLPNPNKLTELIENDEPWLVRVRRKSGRMKNLHLQPDLIIRVSDFIEYERSNIVKHCLKSIVGYQEPDDVFLSSTTGRVLHVDSLSSISRRAFKAAGVRNASIHRLRARFAVRTIEELVEAVFEDTTIGPQSNWVETILTKAAERMGHVSMRSLRPYLTYVLNRRIQTASATQAGKLAARIRQLKLQADAYAGRLSKHQGLHQILLDLDAGRNEKAATAMRKLAAEIDGEAVQ